MNGDRLTLNVAGVEFAGWTACAVTAGIETAARSFSVRATVRYPGESNPLRIAPGMPCAVLLGDELVINGWIDAVAPKQDADTSEITVTGRSRTADLVDCSCLDKPGQFAGMKAEEIAAALAKPYGVDVVAEVSTGAVFGRKAWRKRVKTGVPIVEISAITPKLYFGTELANAGGPVSLAKPVGPVFGPVLGSSLKSGTAIVTGPAVPGHTVEKGETVFESVSRLAEKRGLLVTDDALGRLVLTRAGTGKATTAIVRGGNVISGEAKFDASHVFSEYVVRGQRIGTDTDFGEGVVNPLGTANDPACVRFRRLALSSQSRSTSADCVKEARWEAAARLGKSCTAEYTVRGWRQDDGTLWRSNLLVQVRDPFCALDGEMLITGCTYSLTEDGGTVTTLSLALAAAYAPKPIPAHGGRRQSGYWREIVGGVQDRTGASYATAPKIGKSKPTAWDLSDDGEADE